MAGLLKLGARGPAVRDLQIRLKATGHHEDRCDGIFGPVTEQSVFDFQSDHQLTMDGIVGPITNGALDQAVDVMDPDDEDTPAPPAGEICPADVWAAWSTVVSTITGLPVKYGPGRGSWDSATSSMMVTWGVKPGRFDWRGADGVYPSFHCSSWTNFLVGWLLRVGVDYTGTGNIPPIWDVLMTRGQARYQGIPYRGYAPYIRQLDPSRPYLTAADIWSRRSELSSFVVFAQSTRKRSGGWRWWHHTGAFVTDHRAPGLPMNRIAADGWKSSSGIYSSTPMAYLPLSGAWAANDAARHRYRIYCVEGLGNPEIQARPIPPVSIEVRT